MIKKYQDKKWLENKYWEEELSKSEIAKLCNIGVSTVLYWLKKFNIPRRSQKEALKGIIFSEEHIKNLSKSQKGHIPWNKGKTNIYSKETIKRMIKSHLGQMPGNKGIPHSQSTKDKIGEANKGKQPRLGKKLSEETKLKISKAHMGTGKKYKKYCEICGKEFYVVESRLRRRFCSRICKGKIKKEQSNWKGGITPLKHSIRTNFKSRQWSSDVFTRDNFTCQICGKVGGKLHAHHKKSFSSILQKYEITTLEEALDCEELWNINNGITLCKNCHEKLHKRLRKLNAKTNNKVFR